MYVRLTLTCSLLVTIGPYKSHAPCYIQRFAARIGHKPFLAYLTFLGRMAVWQAYCTVELQL